MYLKSQNRCFKRSVITLLAIASLPITSALAQDQSFEAESSRKLGGGTRVRSVSGASGGKIVDFAGARSYAEWRVTVPEEGNYSLAIKYSNGDATARMAALSVNGSRSSASGTNFPTTGGWRRWGDVVLKVQLKKGVNFIRLTGLRNGPDIDLFTLRGGGPTATPTPGVPVPAATPKAPAPTPTSLCPRGYLYTTGSQMIIEGT